jgi:hypothetical protein
MVLQPLLDSNANFVLLETIKQTNKKNEHARTATVCIYFHLIILIVTTFEGRNQL